MKGKSSTISKAALLVVPNKRTNTGGQLRGYGGGAIIGEAVTSALNARSWQSGHINEGMTPEQCHLIYCNSQQVEEGAGWDRHSSSDLHDQQMDGQDERRKRVYNNRDLTKEGDRKKRGRKKKRKTIAVLRTPESFCRETLKNKEGEFILEPSPRINFHPFSTHSAIPLPYGLVRLLNNSSLRPSSWANFSTKFIVLGLLGFGSFTSTVKDLPKNGPYNWHRL